LAAAVMRGLGGGGGAFVRVIQARIVAVGGG